MEKRVINNGPSSRVEKKIRQQPKRRSYPPSCSEEVLFHILDLKKLRTLSGWSHRNNSAILNQCLIDEQKVVDPFVEQLVELQSYGELLLPPLLDSKDHKLLIHIYDQSSFAESFSLLLAISNWEYAGNDECDFMQKNKAFLVGFYWNFEAFITPKKLLQSLIIYFRLYINKIGMNGLMTIIRELLTSRFQMLKNDKSFEELFHTFVNYLDHLPDVHYGKILSNTWTKQERKINKGAFASTTVLWLDKKPSELNRTIVDFEALHIAQQLTNINQQLVQDVPFEEYRKWGKNQNNCSNIKVIISWFNEVTLWVRTTILELDSIKKQVAVVIHWIKIMSHMVELQNFEGIGPIYFGVSSPSSISRLDEHIPKEILQQKQKIENLLSPNLNYQHYRATLQGLNKLSSHVLQQCVLLKDLSVLEENETFIDEKISWFKLSLLGELLENVRISKESFKVNEVEAADVHMFIVHSFRGRMEEEKIDIVNAALKKDPDSINKSNSKKNIKRVKTYTSVSSSSSVGKLKSSEGRNFTRSAFTSSDQGFIDEIVRSEPIALSPTKQKPKRTQGKTEQPNSPEKSFKSTNILAQFRPERRNSESIAIKRPVEKIKIGLSESSEKRNSTDLSSEEASKDSSVSSSPTSSPRSSPRTYTPRDGEGINDGLSEESVEKKIDIEFVSTERDNRIGSPTEVYRKERKHSFQSTLLKVRNRTLSKSESEISKKT